MTLARWLRHLAIGLWPALASVAVQAQALAVRPVASGLVAPIQLEELPDGSGRMLVVQQNGLVRVLLPGGGVADEPFLDLRPQMLALVNDFEERGLLGLALHPQFARNGRFVVTYSAPLRAGAPRSWNHTRRVSEFNAKPGTLGPVELAGERVLLEQDWPSRKHNGGALAFGPDGMLYIGLGDSGASHGIGPKVLHEAFDVPAELLIWDQLAQDLHSLYGKVLRIDVDRGFPGYAIPPGNPLVGKAGRPEVFAWGFRNPYRIAFDSNGSGDFYITATAETLWEAAYRVRRPGNFGWPLIEGAHCVDRLKPREPPASCPRVDASGQALELPVVEYPNMQVQHPASKLGIAGVGTAITGARIYRGQLIPQLRGQLIFSDWSAAFRQPSGQLFVARPGEQAGALWPFQRVLQIDSRIVGLAEDRAGEVYVLTHEGLGPFGDTGKVFKLVAGP
ncbi:MAG TPA: PQQ-dependent sugar dehydrogenase [Burkholderiaceae bacterium]